MQLAELTFPVTIVAVDGWAAYKKSPDEHSGQDFRGPRQIRDVPDGGQVEFKLTD
jgi:hypothetical protein